MDVSESISDFDLGWLVGIIEGEGTFSVSRARKTDRFYRPRIGINTTDKDVIERVQSIAGGTVVGPVKNFHPRTGRTDDVKDMWRWNLYSETKVREVFGLIIPHLCERRQKRALEILAMCDASRANPRPVEDRTEVAKRGWQTRRRRQAIASIS